MAEGAMFYRITSRAGRQRKGEFGAFGRIRPRRPAGASFRAVSARDKLICKA
jgi:hypothetical protein